MTLSNNKNKRRLSPPQDFQTDANDKAKVNGKAKVLPKRGKDNRRLTKPLRHRCQLTDDKVPSSRHLLPQEKKLTDEKLHKVLAAQGAGSRRNIELLIKQGRVGVNGKTAHIGMRVKPRDRLTVDGHVVARRTAAVRLLCYHKPIGKVVERGAKNSVFDDLPPVNGGRWINIGRLDVVSEGLLLFSTDGNVVQRMAHPRHAVEREYLVRVDGELTPSQIKAISDGVMVDGKPLKPQYFSFHRSGGGRNQWYRVILTEGRNRAVRRLFAYVERQVSRLIRLRMGKFLLPHDLAAGRWRELDYNEKQL